MEFHTFARCTRARPGVVVPDAESERCDATYYLVPWFAHQSKNA